MTVASMSFDENTQMNEVCWSIGKLISSDKNSQRQGVCWSVRESMNSDKSLIAKSLFDQGGNQL